MLKNEQYFLGNIPNDIKIALYNKSQATQIYSKKVITVFVVTSEYVFFTGHKVRLHSLYHDAISESNTSASPIVYSHQER